MEMVNSSSDGLKTSSNTSPMRTKPFQDILESSGDEILFDECVNENPFVDEICFKKIAADSIRQHIIKKRKTVGNTWATLKKTKHMKRSVSVPLLGSERHLIDFWKDFNNGEIFTLPTIGAGKCDSIQRLSVEVVNDVVRGVYNIDYQIIDCRFTYEYEGGHIKDAININDFNDLLDLFKKPKALIFHCEFSSIRGPRMAQTLRGLDRKRNIYPTLNFPEIYVMEGGYKEFFEKHPENCVPQGYVTMNDTKYRDLCRNENKKFRQTKK